MPKLSISLIRAACVLETKLIVTSKFLTYICFSSLLPTCVNSLVLRLTNFTLLPSKLPFNLIEVQSDKSNCSMPSLTLK